MKDPNRGASEEVLARLKEASYEKLRLEIYRAVEKKLEDFEMTWDDLANKLAWPDGEGSYISGSVIKMDMADGPIETDELNQIAAVFSAEVYIIFRPRQPYTGS